MGGEGERGWSSSLKGGLWEVSNCPTLKGTVKRRTLLQKLVGRAGGWLSAGGVCNSVCVSLCACVCVSQM